MRPPPGYPFEGPLPSRPPPPSTTGERAKESPLGLAAFILAFSFAMTGLGFLLVALLAGHLAAHAGDLAAGGPASGFDPRAPDELRTLESMTHVVDSPSMLAPPMPRNVPVHSVRFLEGCSGDDLDVLEEALGTAVARGAPLFNGGDADACVAEYERAARSLESSLPASCRGPVESLAAARATAAGLAPASARAWALRDAFDGLLEVIERSRAGGVSRL